MELASSPRSRPRSSATTSSSSARSLRRRCSQHLRGASEPRSRRIRRGRGRQAPSSCSIKKGAGAGQGRASFVAPRGGKPARRGFHLRAPLFGSGTTPAPATNPNAPSGEGSTVPPMALVPRNAPCPCGSGLKYKRCCLDRERELARTADALEVLGGLASLFPLMRPCGGELEEWLAAHATPDPDPETTAAGIALLSPAERRAIVDAHLTRYPGVWQSLVDDVGGVETAEESAVIGALYAALRETRTPDHLAIQLLGDEDDPAEQLALAIDATNLWSIQEAAALDEVLASLDSDLDDDLYERVWIATIEHIAARF